MAFEVQKGNLYILQKKHNWIKIKFSFRPQLFNKAPVTLSRVWPTSCGKSQLLGCRARLEHMSLHIGRCLLMSPVLVRELREF